jgi:hypothetical protein
MSGDVDGHREPPENAPLGPGRRALIRALASTPVIVTVKSALAQGVSDTPSMGNTRKECSNIANTPADKIPPQCRK